MLKLLFGGIAAALMSVASIFGAPLGLPTHSPPASPNISFGAFGPTGGGTYRLGQSIGTSDSTVKLSSFTEPVSGIKYTMSYLNTTTGYGTIAPQTSSSEFVSFTGITQNSDGSATLTGVTRGLTRTPAGSSCTASTTLAQSHAGQSIFILSDSPCFFAEYAVKQNNENISGIWNFQSLPTSTVTCSQNTQFCTKSYIDAGANAGAATSTFSNIGIVWLASQSQIAAGTASSSSGAPLVIPSKFATSTYNPGSAINIVPITNGSGVIDANFIATSSPFNWIGAHTFSTATTTLNATTTFPNVATTTAPITFGSVKTGWALSGCNASSTVLSSDGNAAPTFTCVAPTIALSQDGSVYSTSNTSTTTLKTFAIPANAITANGTLRLGFVLTGSGANNTKCVKMDFGTGAATTTVGQFCNSATGITSAGFVQMTVKNLNSMSSQVISSSIGGISGVSGTSCAASSYCGYNTTSSITTSAVSYISISGSATNGSDTMTAEGFTLERLP